VNGSIFDSIAMTISEVIQPADRKLFLEVPKLLYRNDPNWVCPLDMEIENTFNPEKNGCFAFGNARRWILRDDHGNLAGRIAAFYDRRKSSHNEQPTGGIGFFECIRNQQAADLLFNTAREWLTGEGMEAMDGPVNFGENFVNWGLLAEGFMQQGYGMQYNFPYYRELFENYGFETYFEQYSFLDNFEKPYPEAMRKFGERMWKKPEFSFRHISLGHPEKFLHEMVYMYDKIWSDFLESYTPLKYEELYHIFKDAKSMLNERYIWFAYHHENPVGFLVVFPDMNQVLRKLKNGKLSVVNIIKLLYFKRRAITRGRLLISGVVPEFQRTGLVGGLYLRLTDAMKEDGLKELELSWVGDYNVTVNKMYSQFGATKEKTHITFRYLFDRNKPFKRFDNLSNKHKRDLNL
jgi:hypothetical protein